MLENREMKTTKGVKVLRTNLPPPHTRTHTHANL